MHGSMGGERRPATVGHAARRQAPLAYPTNLTLSGTERTGSREPLGERVCRLCTARSSNFDTTATAPHGTRERVAIAAPSAATSTSASAGVALS